MSPTAVIEALLEEPMSRTRRVQLECALVRAMAAERNCLRTGQDASGRGLGRPAPQNAS
jgi:hypothetical protein